MSNTKELSIEKKIFAYNFTSESHDLLNIFDRYNKKLNNNLENLKKRNLIYRNPTEPHSFFLDLKKIKLKPTSTKDKQNLTCAFRGVMFRLRDTDLPLVFDIATGNKKGIELSANNSIVEQTHFLAFPELNLIFSEFNNFGARIEKLRSILDGILKLNSYDMKITNLLRKDNYRNIIESKNFKEIEFKLGHTGLKTLKETVKLNLFDDLNARFSELSNFDVYIKITGKGKKFVIPKNKNQFSKSLINLSSKILDRKNNKSLKNDDVSRIRTKVYDSEKVIPIDLLEEKLVHTIKVVKLNPRYKYLNSDDMFDKMLDIYRNNDFYIDRFIPVE